MLECGQFRHGKRPFRFENMWLKSEGFVERVKGWWQSYPFHGTSSYVLAQKLKALKGDLKKWNEECFGNVAVKSHQLLAELRVLETVVESCSLSSNERGSSKKDWWRSGSEILFLRRFVGTKNLEKYG
jgi:hypothetical protein